MDNPIVLSLDLQQLYDEISPCAPHYRRLDRVSGERTGHLYEIKLHAAFYYWLAQQIRNLMLSITLCVPQIIQPWKQ